MEKKRTEIFMKALGAGFAISIAALVNLKCKNSIIGALFFSIGLFLIIKFNLNLFTGKVSYLLDAGIPKKENIVEILLIYIGNILACFSMGYLFALNPAYQDIKGGILTVIEYKSSFNDYSIFSIFAGSAFCNVLIYAAVEGYKNFKSTIEKLFCLIICISTFVICGFEHSIANSFYISFSGAWSIKSIGFLLLVTLGNMFGGFIARDFHSSYIEKNLGK